MIIKFWLYWFYLLSIDLETDTTIVLNVFLFLSAVLDTLSKCFSQGDCSNINFTGMVFQSLPSNQVYWGLFGLCQKY